MICKYIEKYGVKMLNRIFVRESEDFEYIKKKDRIKIGVVSMSQGAGASFVATSVAKEISMDKTKSVAFVEGMRIEAGRTQLYDSLGMDRRFLGKTYFDFFEAVENGMSISERVNLDERINWALNLPSSVLKDKEREKKKRISSLKFISIVNNISANTVVCDLNEYAEDEDILSEMDVIVFVIDPLPSRLITGYDKLCQMKKLSVLKKNVIYLLNKNNEGINRGEMLNFLRIKPEISISFVFSESIYMAEYNCKIPYVVEKINNSIKNEIKTLVNKIFYDVCK